MIGKHFIKLALFDMDGTVFESFLDWSVIRKELNINTGTILESIFTPKGIDKQRLARLEEYETENTQKTKPIAGIDLFLAFLSNLHIHTALITNNNHDNTHFLLSKYQLVFDTVITRELQLWKPSPAALLYAINQYDCLPTETISIGDSYYDLIASKNAKIKHLFLINNKNINRDSFNHSSAGTMKIQFFNDYFDLQSYLKINFLSI